MAIKVKVTRTKKHADLGEEYESILNHYQGVFYTSKSLAEDLQQRVPRPTTIKKTVRGFYLEDEMGNKFGPAGFKRNRCRLDRTVCPVCGDMLVDTTTWDDHPSYCDTCDREVIVDRQHAIDCDMGVDCMCRMTQARTEE